MPDSPSMSVSAMSGLSGVAPLNLTSEAATATRKHTRNKTRTLTPLELDVNFNDENELVRYNDPPPRHASKKYEGFVPMAIDRMESTGGLPTPSLSDPQPQPYQHAVDRVVLIPPRPPSRGRDEEMALH